MLTDPKVLGLHPSASAKPEFLPPDAGFQSPLLEVSQMWNLPAFL